MSVSARDRAVEHFVLDEDEVDFSDALGLLRQSYGTFTSRRAGVRLDVSFDEELRLHRFGARCEYALKLCLDSDGGRPVHWRMWTPGERGGPDFSDFVDCKGGFGKRLEMAVPPPAEDGGTGLQHWTAYAHVRPASFWSPRFAVYGFLWGNEIRRMQDCFRATGRPSFFVPVDRLHPIAGLRRELRARERLLGVSELERERAANPEGMSARNPKAWERLRFSPGALRRPEAIALRA